jgi:ankyrin repeat protein
MLDAEPELVRATYAGAANTMLEAIAQPDIFGEHLEIELGINPRIVELLIERGSDLDGPLNLAACFNRAELIKVLLDGGAQPGISSPIWGITPLQAAIYHGSREAGDLLAARAVVPDALYVAAASGRLEHMERWFDSGGSLKPEAIRLRPNLADVGWPPAPPPRDEPQDVLNEAFALSAYNGRLEAMQRLLDRGADVDGAAHLGLTGLHLAVLRRRVDVARWLVEHGANLSRSDGIHHATPFGWAERTARGSAVYDYLKALTGRSA